MTDDWQLDTFGDGAGDKVSDNSSRLISGDLRALLSDWCWLAIATIGACSLLVTNAGGISILMAHILNRLIMIKKCLT